MKRSSWVSLLAFFASGMLLRVPFRSQFLYHWDSVNFALGLSNYDILSHQPQPPGYILYILLGRLFRLVFVDDNASLVWMSVFFSGLAVAALYWTAARLFDEQVGVVAGLLGLTSPLAWFYSEVALSYTVEAFFVSVIAYLCYRVLTGSSPAVIWSAVALGIAGGFRQNTLVLLLPLWLFSLKAVRWRQRAQAVAALGAVTAVWLVVMVWMSGGPEPFLRAMMSQTGSNLGDSAAGSVQFLVMNLARLGMFTLFATTLLAALLPVLLIWVIKHFRRIIHDPAWQALGLWLLIPLAFYAVYIQQGGHTFTYLPALLIVLAFTLARVIAPALGGWTDLSRAVTGLTGAAVAANLLFFLASGPYLLGIEKFILRTPSSAAIQERDTTLTSKINAIRAQFPPERTLVLAGGMDFRIPDYYLADYRLTFLSHGASGLTNEQIQQAATIQYLVLFNDETFVDSASVTDFKRLSAGAGQAVYWMELGDQAELVLSKQGVSVEKTDQP